MNERQEAIEAFAGGMSIRDIADELEVSIPTIYRWLSASRLVNRFREARNQAIIETYSETDIPVTQIMRSFNISHSALYQILHRNDVPLRRDTERDDINMSDEEIIERYTKQEPISALRLLSGRSNGYIYALLEKNNIKLRRPRNWDNFFS